MALVNELFKRADSLLQTGNTKESAARKLSAEFHAAAYVSKGKLWASYADEKGVHKTVELT